MTKEEINTADLNELNRRLSFIRKQIDEHDRLRILYGGDYIWQDKVQALNDKIDRYKNERFYLRVRRNKLLKTIIKEQVQTSYTNRRHLLGPKRVWIKK